MNANIEKKYPVMLSIAGLDPSGGAGILADVKTASALGVYGCAVTTAITAQNTAEVRAVDIVETTTLSDQLRTLLDDFIPDAVKIGMVPTAEGVETIASILKLYDVGNIILDPVLISSTGRSLVDNLDEAIAARKEFLLPICSLLTPNVPEAEALGLTSGNALCSVLLKGGHSDSTTESNDVLIFPDGHKEIFSTPRVSTGNSHGTGCVLSSGIASALALGNGVSESIRMAKKFVTRGLELGRNFRTGHGCGPLYLLPYDKQHPIYETDNQR